MAGDDSTLFFDSNSQIDLSAPTSDQLENDDPNNAHMAGILFSQDRESDGTHEINSNSVNNIQGVMYFPNGDFYSDSNSSITGNDSPCTMLLAQNIELNSNATFELDWDLTECETNPLASAGGNGSGGIALRR